MPRVKTTLPRLAALLALSFAASSTAAADEVRFRLINGTQYPIRAIALSQSDLGAWGPNVLPAPSIKPGENREVVLRGVFVSCNADMKVTFDVNASEPVWQYLDVCQLKRIRLVYDAQSGITTASYEE